MILTNLISRSLLMFLKKTDKKQFLYFYWLYKILTIATIVTTLFRNQDIPEDFM